MGKAIGPSLRLKTLQSSECKNKVIGEKGLPTWGGEESELGAGPGGRQGEIQILKPLGWN